MGRVEAVDTHASGGERAALLRIQTCLLSRCCSWCLSGWLCTLAIRAVYGRPENRSFIPMADIGVSGQTLQSARIRQ